MHPCASGSADDIMAIDGCGKRDVRVEVFAECRRELAKFIEREPIKFTTFIDRQPYRLADDVVRTAEGNSMM